MARSPKISVSEKTTMEPRTPRLVPEKKPKAVKKPSAEEMRFYECSCCGNRYTDPTGHFYNLTSTPAHTARNGAASICIPCLQKIFTETAQDTGNPALAIATCCHYVDAPFYPDIARQVTLESDFSAAFGIYLSRLNVRGKTMPTFIQSCMKWLTDAIEHSQDNRLSERKVVWDTESRQNMAYVQGLVGYDPFIDPSITESDRQFLFNTMAGYCPDNTVASDSHKLASIINVVSMQLQVQKINELINYELSRPMGQINQADIDKYSTIQKNLLASIDRIAKENGISESGSKANRGANTLSDRIRMIQQEGFQDIEVNMFDIETSAAMQQVADISMQSIIREMYLEDNDYAEIVAEQRETIEKLERIRREQEEELRRYRNEQAELKRKLSGNKKSE